MQINCSYSEIKSISELKPHDKNANKHSMKQIELLAKLMAYQGWRHPIIVSKLSNKIVAGHGRLEAAKFNKWDKCPVDFQDFDNVIQELAFLHSDNTIQELAEIDLDILKSSALELNLSDDFDLDLLGIPDLSLALQETDLGKNTDILEQKKYIIEVEFNNESELIDIKNNLIDRGYIVRIKK